MRDDIKANGLRSPIVLHDGMILDGGNRYRACVDAGVVPTFVTFDGDDVVSFVLSANLHRRHMSAGQQAAIVANAQDWLKAQSHGGDRKSDQSAILHFARTEDRASQSGASLRTQKMADKVAKADPNLAKQVGHGEISLPKAVEQITGKRPGAMPKRIPQEAPENYGPSEEEIRAAEKEAAEEIESLRRVFESDSMIAAAMEENKRYRELARVMESRNNGLMGELAAAKRRIHALEREVAKLKKDPSSSVDSRCKPT